MPPDLLSVELNKEQFAQISRLVYQFSGINLPFGKEGLVKSRLTKRLRALGLNTFEQYLHYVKQDQSRQELVTMVEALTTNKTGFFREAQHFTYFREQIIPRLRTLKGKIRMWSAGCSSGEEPFSIAMTLSEALPDLRRRDVRILATDISTPMLKIAREAIYEYEALEGVPAHFLQKYFTCIRVRPSRAYQLKEHIRNLVRFARLNLIQPWPMKGPFEVIFCRNVMIYFDKSTQQRLIHRFWELLAPGGYLLVGHSESLGVLEHRLHYVQPSVYRKYPVVSDSGSGANTFPFFSGVRRLE